jgi:hypothetical protein
VTVSLIGGAGIAKSTSNITVLIKVGEETKGKTFKRNKLG